jgi:hypothetical protein
MAVYYNGSICDVHGSGREAYQILNNGNKVWTYEFVGDGNWTACSATCGGGTQYQGAICKRNDGVTKTNAFCNADGVATPTLSRPCNTQSCNNVSCTSCTLSSDANILIGQKSVAWSDDNSVNYTCWFGKTGNASTARPLYRNQGLYYKAVWTTYNYHGTCQWGFQYNGQNYKLPVVCLNSPAGIVFYPADSYVWKCSTYGGEDIFVGEESWTPNTVIFKIGHSQMATSLGDQDVFYINEQAMFFNWIHCRWSGSTRMGFDFYYCGTGGDTFLGTCYSKNNYLSASSVYSSAC